MSDLAGSFYALSPPQRPGVKGATADFGGGFFAYYFEQEVTLATGGTTTTSSIVLPVGSLVSQVTVRVTEAITGASNWEVGVSGDTTKFLPNDSNVALGYTVTNQDSFDPAGAAVANGPIVASGAATVLVTHDAPAVLGKMRIGVSGFYLRPFTS